MVLLKETEKRGWESGANLSIKKSKRVRNPQYLSIVKYLIGWYSYIERPHYLKLLVNYTIINKLTFTFIKCTSHKHIPLYL